MQPDNQPVQPISNNQPVSSQPINNQPAKKVGPIIATLVIVLILIIAALYLFASRVNEPAIPTDTNVANTSADQTSTQSVQPVTNNSTDVQSLQNDLNNSTTGLDNQNF